MIGLGAVTAFLGQSKNGIMFGLGAAAAIGWGMWYFSEQAYDRLLTESAEKIERAQHNQRLTEEALKTSEATITQMQQDALESYKIYIKQEAERDQLRRERDVLQVRLSSYRERWENVATKKPELLARIINRATDKRVRRIEAATCRADCDTDEDRDHGAEPR